MVVDDPSLVARAHLRADIAYVVLDLLPDLRPSDDGCGRSAGDHGRWCLAKRVTGAREDCVEHGVAASQSLSACPR